MTPEFAFQTIGLAWCVSWLIAAAWSRPAAARASAGQEWSHRAPVILGALAIAMGHRLHAPALTNPLWRLSEAGQWACVGLGALGFAFAWWARIHLGALWSGNITRKENHRIVDSGPYGLVRHPIYTGILAAFVGAIGLIGSPLSILGFIVFTYGIWRKARIEEGFLREGLGVEAYDAYARRVAMLIPFGPH